MLITENVIVLLGGSFTPSTLAHRRFALTLTEQYARVVIIPCGPRSELKKEATRAVAACHRRELVRLGFANLPPNIEVDYYDLDNNVYTPTYFLQQRYEELFPDTELWHAVGGDLVSDGANRNSEIQRLWTYGPIIWQSLKFVVIVRHGYTVTEADHPPRSHIIEVPEIFGSGTMIRNLIVRGEPFEHLVLPEVAAYIKEYRLFR